MPSGRVMMEHGAPARDIAMEGPAFRRAVLNSDNPEAEKTLDIDMDKFNRIWPVSPPALHRPLHLILRHTRRECFTLFAAWGIYYTRFSIIKRDKARTESEGVSIGLFENSFCQATYLDSQGNAS